MCAGGGVTGAVYEIGCLRALDEVLGRDLADLDLYVGISGGAFVASLLAAGVSPREMYDEAVQPSRGSLGGAFAQLFRWNGIEFLRRGHARTARAGRRAAHEPVRRRPRLERPRLVDARAAAGRPARRPPGSRSTWSACSAPASAPIASPGCAASSTWWPSTSTAARPWPSAARAHRDVPISKAVAASTALPGLYRPVRIKGRDYVDGGVRKTAHINLAIQAGARLVICINPIVPYLNDTAGGALDGHLSNRGVNWVLDQVMRIMLHGRMAVRHGALPARAPGGRHPAAGADARRHADVPLQHHAHERAPPDRRARLPHGARVLQGATRRATGGCSRSTGSSSATRAARPRSRRRARGARTSPRALSAALDRLESRLPARSA